MPPPPLPGAAGGPPAHVLRVPLPGSLAPPDAVRALRADPRPVALLGAWAGGGAILTSDPVRVAEPAADPFALLDAQPTLSAGNGRPGGGAGPPVAGGWFGVLGYRLGGRVEDLPPGPPRPVPAPEFDLAFHDHVVRLDASGRWWFEGLETPANRARLAVRLALWRERLAAGPRSPAAAPAAMDFALRAPGAEGHVVAVADCLERIAAGELFQANLCVRLEAALVGDPLELFATAAAALQPAYAAFVGGAGGAVLSLSPELFLRRRGRVVETAPIKGTSPRSGEPEADARRRAALAASGKDRAENVMIVDLMRNDLGRVCEYGSIVASPPQAEAHAGVWHLVARVRGRVRAGVGDGALLRATFPPGSVTGAPKVQAMKVISELEATGRETYTGAIGFASPAAGLELNVAIRTFEVRGGRVWLGVGGGIVADSAPLAELEEAVVKAAPLVAAVGGRLERPAPAGPVLPVGTPPALIRGRRRPDPSQGVFETVLVRDGRPSALDAHLERLAASVAELHGAALPADTAGRARDAVPGAGSHRMRVLAVPRAGGGLELELTCEVLAGGRRDDDAEEPLRLVPWLLPGGLGAHKWRDRRLLDALAAAGPAGGVPLILDADGAVLEAAWANVWIREGDVLLTPPADGRLLPGVTRARLLATAGEHGFEAVERPLDAARLATADEVLLTSSLRGARSAVLAGGRTAGGSVAPRLRAAVLAEPAPSAPAALEGLSIPGSAVRR